LHHIPFAALPKPQVNIANSSKPSINSQSEQSLFPYLVLDHEIVNLPSISVLAALRDQTTNRNPAPRSIAVFADPVFSRTDPRFQRKQKTIRNNVAANGLRDLQIKQDQMQIALRDAGITNANGDLQRLLFSREEANTITNLAGQQQQSMKALDFQANRSIALSQKLADYRILHFATHSLISNDYPELSAIVLSLFDERGAEQNGFLRLSDIYNMRLPAELVVLSACQTALGKDVRGEGLIGLTRGFMYAGAPRVMASLWRVDDSATADLMKDFYQSILKQDKPMTPAAALRAAQIAALKQRSKQAPYYWAGFTLQGEWR
jgi:CHAT domain-containing protein